MITKSKDYFLVQMLIATWIWVNKIGLEHQVQWGPMGCETNLTHSQILFPNISILRSVVKTI